MSSPVSPSSSGSSVRSDSVHKGGTDSQSVKMGFRHDLGRERAIAGQRTKLAYPLNGILFISRPEQIYKHRRAVLTLHRHFPPAWSRSGH